MTSKTKEVKQVRPLRGSDVQFGIAESKYRQLSAYVPGDTTKEELESSEFWVNYARQLQAGSEVRCLAQDSTFVAYMICTFVLGTDVRMRCTGFHKLQESISDDEVDNYQVKGYKVKNGGATGFYIQVESTGDRLFGKSFPTQIDAMIALRDHAKALSA